MLLIVMDKIFSFIQKKNTLRKLRFILPYFGKSKKVEKVLDFGGGDLSLALALKKALPKLKITAIDIVDFGHRPRGITFLKYPGKKIPFSDNSFDIVLCFHSLHHCQDLKLSFAECCRVSSRRIILVEPLARFKFEIPLMKFMDFLFNIWKSKSINFSFQFLREEDWHQLFAKHHFKVVSQKDVELLPKIFPTGRSYLFELCRQS